MPRAKTIIPLFYLLSTSLCFSLSLKRPVSNIDLLRDTPDPNLGQETNITQLVLDRFSNPNQMPMYNISRILQTTKLKILSSDKSQCKEYEKRMKKYYKEIEKRNKKNMFRDQKNDSKDHVSGYKRYSRHSNSGSHSG